MKLNQIQITEAIKSAEQNTSGEIQVYVTKKKVEDVYAAAQIAFEKIGLGKTKEKNAILFFLATKSRSFAILGDIGIHQKVHQEFWNELSGELTKYFQKSEFTEGLCKTIMLCGQKLKQYFPCQKDDVNELSDAVHFDDK